MGPRLSSFALGSSIENCREGFPRENFQEGKAEVKAESNWRNYLAAPRISALPLERPTPIIPAQAPTSPLRPTAEESIAQKAREKMQMQSQLQQFAPRAPAELGSLGGSSGCVDLGSLGGFHWTSGGNLGHPESPSPTREAIGVSASKFGANWGQGNNTNGYEYAPAIRLSCQNGGQRWPKVPTVHPLPRDSLLADYNGAYGTAHSVPTTPGEGLTGRYAEGTEAGGATVTGTHATNVDADPKQPCGNRGAPSAARYAKADREPLTDADVTPDSDQYAVDTRWLHVYAEAEVGSCYITAIANKGESRSTQADDISSVPHDASYANANGDVIADADAGVFNEQRGADSGYMYAISDAEFVNGPSAGEHESGGPAVEGRSADGFPAANDTGLLRGPEGLEHGKDGPARTHPPPFRLPPPDQMRPYTVDNARFVTTPYPYVPSEATQGTAQHRRIPQELPRSPVALMKRFTPRGVKQRTEMDVDQPPNNIAANQILSPNHAGGISMEDDRMLTRENFAPIVVAPIQGDNPSVRVKRMARTRTGSLALQPGRVRVMGREMGCEMALELVIEQAPPKAMARTCLDTAMCAPPSPHKARKKIEKQDKVVSITIDPRLLELRKLIGAAPKACLDANIHSYQRDLWFGPRWTEFCSLNNKGRSDPRTASDKVTRDWLMETMALPEARKLRFDADAHNREARAELQKAAADARKASPQAPTSARSQNENQVAAGEPDKKRAKRDATRQTTVDAGGNSADAGPLHTRATSAGNKQSSSPPKTVQVSQGPSAAPQAKRAKLSATTRDKTPGSSSNSNDGLPSPLPVDFAAEERQQIGNLLDGVRNGPENSQSANPSVLSAPKEASQLPQKPLSSLAPQPVIKSNPSTSGKKRERVVGAEDIQCLVVEKGNTAWQKTAARDWHCCPKQGCLARYKNEEDLSRHKRGCPGVTHPADSDILCSLCWKCLCKADNTVKATQNAKKHLRDVHGVDASQFPNIWAMLPVKEMTNPLPL